jgi:Helix-turn-helix of DDE superfamily endonuclease
MLYQTIRNKSASDFKRLTGVEVPTFERMRQILNQAKSKYGRNPKLRTEDQLLMALMYWREYRTMFHIASDYGISESRCSRTIKFIEDTLTSHTDFQLPKRPTRPQQQTVCEVMIIDATESPIERPKKRALKSPITVARRDDTRSNRRL